MQRPSRLLTLPPRAVALAPFRLCLASLKSAAQMARSPAYSRLLITPASPGYTPVSPPALSGSSICLLPVDSPSLFAAAPADFRSSCAARSWLGRLVNQQISIVQSRARAAPSRG
jgi:hypothetical protein